MHAALYMYACLYFGGQLAPFTPDSCALVCTFHTSSHSCVELVGAWRPSALFARALVDQRHWSRGDAYRWLHRFVCELEHVRTFSRKALQVQLLIFQHAAGEAFLTGIQRDHLPGGVERHRGGLLLILSKIPKSQASTRRPGQTSCSAAALMTAPTGLGLVHDAGRSVAALLLVPDIPRPQAA